MERMRKLEREEKTIEIKRLDRYSGGKNQKENRNKQGEKDDVRRKI